MLMVLGTCLIKGWKASSPVSTKHAHACAGKEMQGGSHWHRGTKGICELSRPQFISLAPGIVAIVPPSDDGQELDK